MLARAAALVAARATASAAGPATVCRAYAAAAAPQDFKLPDAPLSLSSTSGSIATLVWQIARKENVLEKVQDELAQMVEVFASHPKLRELALDPFVPRVARVKIMTDLLNDSGATEITKRLFASLAEENALAATLQVSNSFDELMLAHKKEVYCTIVTAAPMDKLEKVEMTKQAEQFVDAGFKLVMKEKVDKKLLGGFVLEFEDRLVDMSVAKKMEEFNNLVAKLEADLRV